MKKRNFKNSRDGLLYYSTQRGAVPLGSRESAEMLLEDGKRIRFRPDQTEAFRPLETSLMPEDLVESMSTDELRDLLAYLDSLR
jgi:hypothetical protein